ncbi:uncharacterized protein RCO7_02306 [Rhynchosporium graminicola]|uniref:Uncharacterized protein n=1 Tax=Rhynchosporium graminicola TaxID=2792576 RepID=A0A1E1JW02_9HELO|nr:uncharacterized protein RCO7_02306 [Rhynchosporium commune]
MAATTNSASSPTPTRYIPARPKLQGIPLEIRYMIYREMASNRTVYLNRIPRFSSRTLTDPSHKIGVPHPKPLKKLNKDGFEPLFTLDPRFEKEFNEWAKIVPELRNLKCCGVFMPESTIFITDGNRAVLERMLRNEVFREGLRQLVIDTRKFKYESESWSRVLVRAISRLRDVKQLKRLDIRCAMPMSDVAKLRVMITINEYWGLCLGGCTCGNAGTEEDCEKRFPVVRWQVPNRRCGRGKWKTIPNLRERTWSSWIYRRYVRPDEKEKIGALKKDGRIGQCELPARRDSMRALENFLDRIATDAIRVIENERIRKETRENERREWRQNWRDERNEARRESHYRGWVLEEEAYYQQAEMLKRSRKFGKSRMDIKNNQKMNRKMKCGGR